MLSRIPLAATLLCAIISSPLSAAADQRADGTPATSITIYSAAVHSATEARGRAFVQQRRRIELPRGDGRIEITDVPTMLDPASVLLRSAGDDAPFVIAEQHLHDVATDPDAVLRQYVGQEILINRRQSGPGDQARLTETIHAKLLAFDEKVLVLQTNNRQLPVQIIARGPEITEIKLTRAGNMAAMRPTLSWQVSTDEPGPRDVDLIYETRGVGWDANYTLLLDGDGPGASLEAWANVVNRSGAAFADAELRLVLEGGGPDREQRPVSGARYSIPRRVTLPPDGTRRFSLLGGSKRVNLARLNVLAPSRAADVMECLSLPNTSENHLGLALPPGRVRVLQKGDDGAPVTLLAHSRVSPTAPDVSMIVPLARADGLVATRAVANSHETIDGAQRVARLTTVTIANRRKHNAQVLLIEDLGDRAARVIRHSHPYDERASAAGAGAAGSIEFLLEIPSGETQTVSFAVAVE